MRDDKLPTEDDFNTVDKIIVGFFIVFLILTVATPLLISSHPLP
jgi:hypothetical protein